MKDKGGVIVDTRAWEKMKKNLMKGSQLAVKVGAFEDAKYGSENDNLNVAQVMQWQEEGTQNIPMRPFIRYYFMQLESDEKLVKELSWAINQIAVGGMTWTQLYNRLGEELSEDLKKVVEQWKIPPNAEYTVEQKGFNDPLIDTGLMKDSITHKIGRK